MENTITIAINPTDIGKKILCYADLYTSLGIIKAIQDTYKGDKKYHYANLRASKHTIKKIEEVFKHNILNTNNKFKRLYKEDKLISMHLFDCMLWSPYEDCTCADNTIVLLLPNHPEFKESI